MNRWYPNRPRLKLRSVEVDPRLDWRYYRWEVVEGSGTLDSVMVREGDFVTRPCIWFWNFSHQHTWWGSPPVSHSSHE